MRADLQHYYGINLDNVEECNHSPHHIAELVRFLPQESCVGRAYDEDAAWNYERTLLAAILNSLNLLIWGMSDKSKRGAKPEQVGPSYMRFKKRTLDAQVMPISELMEKLQLERR